MDRFYAESVNFRSAQDSFEIAELYHFAEIAYTICSTYLRICLETFAVIALSIKLIVLRFVVTTSFSCHYLAHLRMPPPDLPRNQDCHELWIKKRRRQLREQQSTGAGASSTANSTAAAGTGSQPPSVAPPPPDESSKASTASDNGSATAMVIAEKMNEDSTSSLQG